MSNSNDKRVKWNDFIEWKWSHGELYEKSPRQRRNQKYISKSQQQSQQQLQQQMQNDYDIEDAKKSAELAFQQSLLSENDVWSLEEQQIFVNQEKPANRREDTYNRMAERELVGQIGMNPFVQRNYLEDVMIQDNYLKPISTSIEREKFKESE
jgi:hypothetical protein